MRLFLSLLIRNRLAALGAVLLLMLITLCLLVPLLPLANPDVTDTANKFLRPFSPGHLLGTDHLGRDLLSRLRWGTRLSLTVGFVAAMTAAFFGPRGHAPRAGQVFAQPSQLPDHRQIQ